MSTDLTALRSLIEDCRSDMLADLAHYVGLETPSDDRVALEKGAVWLRLWIEDRIGPPCNAYTVSGGNYGDIEVLEFPAQSGSQPNVDINRLASGSGGISSTVVILAHYDTVWPVGTLGAMPFEVVGDIIRGPGVFDMKTGLVQAVWAIRSLRLAGLPCPALRLVINGDEELGSPASRHVIEDSCRNEETVLVFEGSAGGAVKTARKGTGLFNISLTGVEGHAGLDPRKGASAINALAEFIAHATSLTNLDAGTSVNVGVVSGGSRPNVTAGTAHASVDARINSQSEADRVFQAFNDWQPSDHRVKYQIEGGWNRPAMVRSRPTAALFNRAHDLANSLGFELKEVAVGGASDGNFAAALGCAVLDGLGAVGDGAHARSEYARVSGMVERTALAAAILLSLAEDQRSAPPPRPPTTQLVNSRQPASGLT